MSAWSIEARAFLFTNSPVNSETDVKSFRKLSPSVLLFPAIVVLLPRWSSGGDFTKTHHSTSYDYISPLKLDLAGKHVLITGAAWEHGVGYAAAMAFRE